MNGKIAYSPIITSVDEIKGILKMMPPAPMQPLCMGSPFLQCGGRENQGPGADVDVILTVSAAQKVPREDRHLKFVDVHDIFEVFAVTAYPTIALYPGSMRRACGEEVRRQLLMHSKLHTLLPRARKSEILGYVEHSRQRNSEEMDALCAEWFGKILNREGSGGIQYTHISVPRRALRVPII